MTNHVARLRILFENRLPLANVLLLCAALNTAALAQSGGEAAQLTIEPARIVSPISPTLYGLMTEEINHSYDGGLYAEMIQNRAFHSDWEGEPPWDLVRRGNAVAKQVSRPSQPGRAALCRTA